MKSVLKGGLTYASMKQFRDELAKLLHGFDSVLELMTPAEAAEKSVVVQFRRCLGCKGTGVCDRVVADGDDGTIVSAQCPNCNGSGAVPILTTADS